jgi:sugar/nucleoside kinase (ribokinase family)
MTVALDVVEIGNALVDVLDHKPPVPLATDGPATGRCIIVVTPDAQRTMNTYLGASTDLGPGDVDPELIARAKLIYLEGYLWDRPSAKDAFRKAAALAHEFGRRVALTLSDPFCVDRHRDSFVELIDGAVDVLFANEEEIVSLFRVASFDEAVRQVRGRVSVAALRPSKRSGQRPGRERPGLQVTPRHWWCRGCPRVAG